MGHVPTKYDVFISHASEDKELLVRELAIALRNLGLRVWYDEFTLRPGDSLSESIDRGLASSHFGLVILSPWFFQKQWPRQELRGLVAREIDQNSTIIPVWHGVSRQDVAEVSPSLADKMALRTTDTDAATLALQILQCVDPARYLASSRADLQRQVGEDVIVCLQAQIDAAENRLQEAHDALARFQCPTCKADLSSTGIIEHEYGDSRIDRFECGYESIDGYKSRLCRKSPEFPSLDDFDIHTRGDGRVFLAWAVAKTELASMASIPGGHGRTAEEAIAHLIAQFPGKSPPQSSLG